VHTHSPAYAGTAPSAVSASKPSRYARVYSGTSPKPVIGYAAETPYNNLPTSNFFSFNSATDASIFARLKSFVVRPGGDGIHGDTSFHTWAISPRKSAHAFYNRCAARVMQNSVLCAG
jgi:hypothetical protein